MFPGPRRSFLSSGDPEVTPVLYPSPPLYPSLPSSVTDLRSPGPSGSPSETETLTRNPPGTSRTSDPTNVPPLVSSRFTSPTSRSLLHDPTPPSAHRPFRARPVTDLKLLRVLDNTHKNTHTPRFGVSLCRCPDMRTPPPRGVTLPTVSRSSKVTLSPETHR